MTAMLFGNLHNNAEVTARVLIALKYFWNVEHIGDVGKSVIVQAPFFSNTHEHKLAVWRSYDWYCLTDNGGEVNVELINMGQMRSIPYTSNQAVLTGETIAWRLWCAMTGMEIDWSYNDIPGAHGAEPLKIQEMY